MKKGTYSTVLSILVFTFFSCGTSKSLHQKPQLKGYNDSIPIVDKQSIRSFSSGKNFLIKNQQNLWELYVEGDALERGLVTGALTDSILKTLAIPIFLFLMGQFHLFLKRKHVLVFLKGNRLRHL